MTISLKTLYYFNSNEGLILHTSKDKNGKETLRCLKKGFWSFIAIKILHLKSYQLQTIVRIVKEQEFNLKSSMERHLVESFYDKLNKKIKHYNARHLNSKIPLLVGKSSIIPPAPSILNLEKIQSEGYKAQGSFKKNQAQAIIQAKVKQPIPEIVTSSEDLLQFFEFQLAEESFKNLDTTYKNYVRSNPTSARACLNNKLTYLKQDQENDLRSYKKSIPAKCDQDILNFLNFSLKMPDPFPLQFSDEFSKIFSALTIYLIDILPQKEQERIDNLLKDFWQKPYEEQKQLLLEIHNDLQKAFLEAYSNYSSKQLCKYLYKAIYDYRNQNYLPIALQDIPASNNLKKSLAWGINEGVLTFFPIGILNSLMEKLKTLRKDKFESAFFDRFIYVRENKVSFSRLYNNPYLSDQKFIIGKETFHVHKAIVRSIPALQKYSIKNEDQVIINENIDDVKLNLEIAYDHYYFDHFKNEYKDLLACKRYLGIQFNNPKDSDFVIESAGEKLHVHKAILECSDLDYFKAIFRGNMKENKDSKLVVELEEFEVLKVILEYVYTNVMPEFENEESKKIFEDSLNYYRAR